MSRTLTIYPILFTALTLSATAGTIVSENFDSVTAQLGLTSAGVFQAYNGTNIDIVGASNGYPTLCAGPASGNCLDLDGSGGNPQGMIRLINAITLQPGVNYYLSFDLIGSGRGVTTSTSVSFGSYSQDFTLTANDLTSGVVTNQLVTVNAPTMANLVFQSNTPGQIGAVLDNVTITSALAEKTAVPEPGTMGLMLALAATAWFVKRVSA
jgi:hypothetical protein